MKRPTRECVLALIACLRDAGPLRRDHLASACRLSAAELTRALKSARQMGVVEHLPADDDVAQTERLFGLTGRALPPARRVAARDAEGGPSFQPLLDAWGIARPSRRRGSHPP
ncbi:hypothetical protein LMG31506_04438 [Cupriavidus yeoncheonensis]|uniref:Uncharacterized protein n=1 Tax=Cupriavidus yeoncheonensis TaxID=1462994 RepID=A0A916IY14_9BURK|nr:hypothetical protein [Cupriavidus yeoncheonensis]CAG2151537.1 hypothetical protein LMG31506_04438 [Cupriavidus yeoncheonensis]